MGMAVLWAGEMSKSLGFDGSTGNDEEKVTTGGIHRGKCTFFSKVGQEIHDLPSGNLLHSCGKSSFLMGISTINGHVQ